METFHNDIKIKEKYLKRLEAHHGAHEKDYNEFKLKSSSKILVRSYL